MQTVEQYIEAITRMIGQNKDVARAVYFFTMNAANLANLHEPDARTQTGAR